MWCSAARLATYRPLAEKTACGNSACTPAMAPVVLTSNDAHLKTFTTRPAKTKFTFAAVRMPLKKGYLQPRPP